MKMDDLGVPLFLETPKYLKQLCNRVFRTVYTIQLPLLQCPFSKERLGNVTANRSMEMKINSAGRKETYKRHMVGAFVSAPVSVRMLPFLKPTVRP